MSAKKHCQQDQDIYTSMCCHQPSSTTGNYLQKRSSGPCSKPIYGHKCHHYCYFQTCCPNLAFSILSFSYNAFSSSNYIKHIDPDTSSPSWMLTCVLVCFHFFSYLLNCILPHFPQIFYYFFIIFLCFSSYPPSLWR